MKKYILTLIALLFSSEAAMAENQKKAIFAGGCFWCTEAALDKVDGVLKTTSGFAGGSADDADYYKVATGKTGHFEAVEVVYDGDKVSYSQLLDAYWRSIDPTDPRGQFADRGKQYQTAILYLNDKQKQEAEKSKIEIAKKLDETIYTEILPAGDFYAASESHQDYHLKNPTHYKRYYIGSGRARKLKEMWAE